jgi:hypothetical protein
MLKINFQLGGHQNITNQFTTFIIFFFLQTRFWYQSKKSGNIYKLVTTVTDFCPSSKHQKMTKTQIL